MLTEHKFKKGKFITPFNQHFQEVLKENSWFYGRMPEYIWLGLIIDNGKREDQLEKCIKIMNYLHDLVDNKEINFPKISLIFNLPKEKQKDFYEFLKDLDVIELLKPVSLIFSTESDIFLDYIKGYDLPVRKRISTLNDVLHKLMDHQSDLSTDVRFLIIYKFILSGKLHFLNSMSTDFIKSYPLTSHDDPKMRIFRAQIRSTELAISSSVETDNSLKLTFIQKFWERLSLITDCEVFSVELNNEEHESVNLAKFKENVYDILLYYTKLLQETRPLDNKMLVLLGVFTYSYKRLIELVDHNLEQTISGRTITRSIIENYMMTKYLLDEELKHENIWKEYQYYGIGQYKLVYKRFDENKPDITKTHVPFNYIKALVSEFKDEEFIDMDTSYFGKGSARNKFKQVDEEDLWKYYYDYDSSFEHGLWGAIRESSILKCDSPGHHYHGVPDVDNLQKLKSVADDCIMVISRHLRILDKEYPIPKTLKEELPNE